MTSAARCLLLKGVFGFGCSLAVMGTALGDPVAVGIWMREEKSDASIDCVLLGTGTGKFSLSVRAPSGKLIARRSYLAADRQSFEMKVPSSAGFSVGSYEATSSSPALIPVCQVLAVPRIRNGDHESGFRYSPPSPRTGALYLSVSTIRAHDLETHVVRPLLLNSSPAPAQVRISRYSTTGMLLSSNEFLSLQPGEVGELAPVNDSSQPATLLVATPDRGDASLSMLAVHTRSSAGSHPIAEIRFPISAACELPPLLLPRADGAVRHIAVSNTSTSTAPFEVTLFDRQGTQLGTLQKTIGGLSTDTIALVGYEEAELAKVSCTSSEMDVDSGGLIALATTTMHSKGTASPKLQWSIETQPIDAIPSTEIAVGILSVNRDKLSSAVLVPLRDQDISCSMGVYDRSGNATGSRDVDLVAGCLPESDIGLFSGDRFIEASCDTSQSSFGGGLIERTLEGGELRLSYAPLLRSFRTANAARPTAPTPRKDLNGARKLSLEGHQSLKSGRFEEAIAKFTQASKLAPGYHCLLTWIVEAYERNGNRAAALASVKQLLAVDPANEFARSKEAHYALEAGRYREAIEGFEKLLLRSPENSDFNANLGIGYARLGNFPAAHVSLAKALSIGPHSPRALWALLELHEREHSSTEATTVEGHILSVPVSEPRPIQEQVILRGARAYVYARRRQHELAVGELKEADKIAPGDHRVVWNLAEQLGALKQWEAALPYARQATVLYPGNAGYVATLGWILLEKGEIQQARSVLSGALSSGIESARIRVNLGMVFARTGDLDEALREFELATTLDASDWVGFNNAGWIAELKGNFGDAYERYSKAVQLNPESELVQANLKNLKRKLSREPGTNEKQ